MNTYSEPSSHISSSYSDPVIKPSNTMATMITVHGNNSNNAATAITTGIPMVSSYSNMENDDLLDDYSTSTFSTNTLSAPPPSPQDASPIDNLFAQHLTSQLQQTLIFATSTTSPPSTHSSMQSDIDSNNMDISSLSSSSSSSPFQENGPSTTIAKTNHLAPVMVPGALPLSCTTTYRHSTKLTTKHHHGVDPLELDFLLRRVNKSHHRHSHSLDQPRPFRPHTKRIGGFHKRPSRIPLYTKRLVHYGDKDQRMEYETDGSRTYWKQNASRQKCLAISTAVEKWKQLKHYEQSNNNNNNNNSNNNSNSNSNNAHEVDRIVHDLKEMGL